MLGMHYFYKVTPTSQCGDLQGAFLLYEKGKLIGLGLNPFGSFTSGQRTWFEDVPPKVVKVCQQLDLRVHNQLETNE